MLNIKPKHPGILTARLSVRIFAALEPITHAADREILKNYVYSWIWTWKLSPNDAQVVDLQNKEIYYHMGKLERLYTSLNGQQKFLFDNCSQCFIVICKIYKRNYVHFTLNVHF